MDSWWSLGEWSGYDGTKLALYRITCPFCMETGNFSTEFHAVKKQPNGGKALNFDTLKCGNCSAFVQVFWSAGDTVHDYRVQPWPLKIERAPEHYPEAIGREEGLQATWWYAQSYLQRNVPLRSWRIYNVPQARRHALAVLRA